MNPVWLANAASKESIKSLWQSRIPALICKSRISKQTTHGILNIPEAAFSVPPRRPIDRSGVFVLLARYAKGEHKHTELGKATCDRLLMRHFMMHKYVSCRVEVSAGVGRSGGGVMSTFSSKTIMTLGWSERRAGRGQEEEKGRHEE